MEKFLQKRRIVLRNIALPYKECEDMAIAVAAEKLKKCRIPFSDVKIHKRSVDARKKDNIKFVYSVEAKSELVPDEKTLIKLDAALLEEAEDLPECGKKKAEGRIIVVGFGPCGMFAALTLARAGYRPLVIERGDGVAERQKKVARFLETGELDTDSNVQFGAGGAGTFSDGKLITRINDPMGEKVLQTLCEFGAPKNILTLAKPHVGTDRLGAIVEGIEREIVKLGGEVRYRTTVTDAVCSSDGRVKEIVTSEGSVACAAVIMAVGHSARDTYRMLQKRGFLLQPKDFSVGARVEHLQEDIDFALYGNADISILGHGEYTLSFREDDRGVYSFCMCPGGTVVCASSEEGGLVVNGMSNFARDGKNANSAIAVSVLKADYGNDPMKAISYQEGLERRAFELAGGGYNAPTQTLGDFLSGKSGSTFGKVKPSFRNGEHSTLCDLHAILPANITGMLEKGFSKFERQISCFSAPDAILTGVETRTSSPLRIPRGSELTAEGYCNLYPCGEGAGYAGGITSAAVDGMRIAYKVISEYAPDN